MGKPLLFLISLLLLYAYGFSQDSVIESKYSFGASVTGLYNFIPPSSHHVKCNVFKGGSIGSYYAIERNRVRWDAEVNLGITNYQIQYTHPLYEQYKVNLKQTLYSFHIDIAFSLKVYLSHISRMDVGGGLFFGNDGRLFAQETDKVITESFFDPDIGRENNRIVLYSDIIGNLSVSNGWFFHLTYRSLHTRYPFFIRLRSNLTFPGKGFQVNFLAFDHLPDQELIDFSRHFDPRLTFSMAFGWDLWRSSRIRKVSLYRRPLN
ncbi:MAG: hypothetical protein KL787_05860 [Taibaiella sp.]|nr:hypothetical protein [Taibaiella sp.]